MRKVILIFFMCLSMAASTFAQLNQYEEDLIEQVDHHDPLFDPRKPEFMKIGPNAITRYNPVSLFFAGSLYFYQKVISPQLQSSCPYVISCSAFSKASIEEFGPIKGIPMTADRLTRCTQFTLMDIHNSQIDQKTGRIIDEPSKYRVHQHKHDHKH